jgi:tRNA A37 threonylcarbamoyladenosine synthetase subunit TsaC/SUA5/YrdC
VIDLTGAEPRVLREGAVPAAEALGRLASGVRSS